MLQFARKRGLPVVITASLGVLLGGCSEYLDRRDYVSLHSGDAVAANRAIHTADPWPREARNNNLSFDARRLSHAIEAYETKVEPEGDEGESPASAAVEPAGI